MWFVLPVISVEWALARSVALHPSPPPAFSTQVHLTTRGFRHQGSGGIIYIQPTKSAVLRTSCRRKPFPRRSPSNRPQEGRARSIAMMECSWIFRVGECWELLSLRVGKCAEVVPPRCCGHSFHPPHLLFMFEAPCQRSLARPQPPCSSADVCTHALGRTNCGHAGIGKCSAVGAVRCRGRRELRQNGSGRTKDKNERDLRGQRLGQMLIVIVRGVFLSTRHNTQPASVAFMMRDSWKPHLREERMAE